MAFERTAAKQAMMRTSCKLDVVLCQAGDIRKQVTGMRDQLRRMEIMLQKIVYSQRNTTEPALGRMTKPVVRYEADASDSTAVWRILHLRPSEEPRNVPDQIQPAEVEMETTRMIDELRQISLNDTQEIQSVSIPEGNLHFPSTDLSEVVTGWGEDPLPHDFIAFPHLNNLNPSHGPEMAKDMEKGVSAVAKKHAQNDIVGQNINLTTAARGKLLNEAQFDLAQLYMGKRADKKLRGTGLFWKTPPWPDFCIEELKAVYKSELMKMRHEVEEERMMLQMARVWRVERVQRKLVVAKLTVDSKYAPLNKLQSDLEEFLSFHRGNSVDEEIHKSAEESGDSRIAKKCLGMLKAMRSHHEYNYVAYRKGIGVVCNKKGEFGVDDRWLWSTGLLWNLPPWPDLSLCEADWMAIDIEKGAAAMCLRMAAMFGGIVGQEVVQACSGKFHPVYQFFYIDSVESLTVEPLESGDLKPENTRYTTQISVFGSKLRKKLEQAKIFTDGSGALGCEVLKNLALMGISCSPDGKLTVTDDDVIEQSNFSRQFLVHDWNSGQTKSTVAATVVMAIDSKNYVEAQMWPKSHYCYLIRLTLEYCKFSSLDADEITKESRRRISNSFGKIRYCLNDVGLLGASEAIRISIEMGQKKGWLKGASDATYQESDATGLCLFAEISALHMKFFEEVLHLIVKRLQQEMEHLSYYTVPCLTGGSSSIDVLEVVGQNYSDFVLNITSKKLKPGVPSDKNPQDVTSGTNNSDSQKCNSEQIYSANGVASQDINSTDEHIGDCKVESSVFPLSSEDTISETGYPADNWNSCQFALSNGSPVHNNQSVPQSGLSYGDNDLSYIDWPGIDNFEEDDTLFRCDSTYGQQQLENTEELSLILSSSDAIYSSDVALQPGFEPSYSDYGILDDLSAFNGTHDKLYTVVTGKKVRILVPGAVLGHKKYPYGKSVQHPDIWRGKTQESDEDVPCVNAVAMVGLDQFITKKEALTNEKAYSGKFHSHYQFFYFDSFQKRRRDANVFVVGSGTLGCEFLKNLALMRVPCSHKGTLILIHEDFIAKSIWSRQYLCRDWNIGLAKSTIAAAAACATNSCLHTDTLQNRACPETEYVFPMHSRKPLILSLMHLITSRLGCIWYYLGFLISILEDKYVARGGHCQNQPSWSI